MQSVSNLYKSIAESHDYHVETALILCDNSIPLSSDYTDSTHKTLVSAYDEEMLWSISTTRNAFSNNKPEVGCCTCGEIDLQMLKPSVTIPQMARITPYVRLVKHGNGNSENLLDSENRGWGGPIFDYGTAVIKCTFYPNVELKANLCLHVEYDCYLRANSNDVVIVSHELNNVKILEEEATIEINGGTRARIAFDFSVTQAQINSATTNKLQLCFKAKSTLTSSAYISGSGSFASFVPSEWIRKGVYFIDSRNVTKNDDELNILTLHGYDAMLKTEDNYPSTSQASPTDIQAVNEIATSIGVDVDPRTTAIINKGYIVTGAIGFTMREVLGQIASVYGGNFIINDIGLLQLICLWDLPEETNLLTDESYNKITFGVGANETRINLGDEA